MAIEKGAPLCIEQVGNGFVVTPDRKGGKGELKPDQLFVFESAWNLGTWLTVHFAPQPENQPAPVDPAQFP